MDNKLVFIASFASDLNIWSDVQSVIDSQAGNFLEELMGISIHWSSQPQNLVLLARGKGLARDFQQQLFQQNFVRNRTKGLIIF